jgi:hypothetical protein
MYFWVDLDAEMLLESAANQQPDGKIPVTVLPVIVRDDNIDTTAYFVCRVARHFQFTADLPLLQTLYPNVQRALAYLRSRDNASVGVPEALATSQWADWLDGARRVCVRPRVGPELRFPYKDASERSSATFSLSPAPLAAARRSGLDDRPPLRAAL